MIVGLDLDGVVADFTAGWVDTYNHWFEETVSYLEVTDWSSLVELTHFDTETAFFEWLLEVQGFWSELPVIPGALGGISLLQAAGVQFRVITNRPTWSRSQTERWLQSTWPATGPAPVPHFVADKTTIDCQVYIDDSPIVLNHLKKANRRAITFDQPWNRHVHHHPRAKGWADLTMKLLDRHEEWS